MRASEPLLNGMMTLAAQHDVSTANISSFQDVVGYEITVPEAGRYRLEAVVHGRVGDGADDGQGLGLVITDSSDVVVNDGGMHSLLRGQDASLAQNTFGHIDSTTLVAYVTTTGLATYKVRVSQVSNSPGNFVSPGSTLRYEQLSTETVADPDLVPVEDLEVLEGDTSGTGSPNPHTLLSGGRTWNDLITDYEKISIEIYGVTGGERFRFTDSFRTADMLQGDLLRVLDGNTGGAFWGQVRLDDLNSSDAALFFNDWASWSIKVYGIKAQKNVISQNTTEVSSGTDANGSWLDIGDVRQAWGTTGGGVNAVAVTFPNGGFGAVPNVEVTAINGGPRTTSADAITSTGATVIDDAGSTKMWRAIGPKP